MPHLVLLGDSIFDNAAYVAGDLSVLSQVRLYLPPDWKATLLAVDGSTSRDLFSQVEKIPPDASHLILSTGGNDALQELPILQEPAVTVSDAVERIASMAEEFRANYRRAAGWLRETQRPFALCTIYHPRFPDPRFQRIAESMLAIFNDIILGQAIESGLPVLDLRRICDQARDFSNTIEPSEIGGRKIAAGITRLLRDYPFGSGRREIFT